jgi:selenocysteine lyase/cysteine desulfurase
MRGLFIPPIADLVHSKGAKPLADEVLGLGHVPTDVKVMDCDFYAAGFHKFACGPRATAVFYVRADVVGQLPPLFGNLDEDGRGFQKPKWNSNSMDKYEVFGAHPEGQFPRHTHPRHALTGGRCKFT